MQENIWDTKQWMLWGYDNGQKRPISLQGRWSGSTWTEDYASYSDACDKSDSGRIALAQGLAFCFTENDAFVGFDIDDCISEDGEIADWAKDVIDAWKLRTYGEYSPSGKGIKFYGRAKFPDDFREKFKSAVSIGEGASAGAFEIYDHGRFFAFTDQPLEEEVEIGDVQDLVDDLLDRFMRKKNAGGESTPAPAQAEPEGVRTHSSSDWNAEQRIDAYIRRSVENDGLPGRGERTIRLFKLAGGIFASNITQDENLVTEKLWHFGLTFDPPWGDEYPIEDLHRQVANSKHAGTPPTPNPRDASFDLGDEHPEADWSALVKTPEDSPKTPVRTPGQNGHVEAPDPGPFPIDVTTIPGFLGDVTRYILETSHIEQPELSFAAALGLLSTMIARKVYEPMFNIKASLFILGLSPSGTGKDIPLKTVKRILMEAGAMHLFASDGITSGSGIVTTMHCPDGTADMYGNCIFTVDEVGFLLDRGQRDRSIEKTLLELYSANGMQYWQPNAYANLKDNKEINAPAASLLAVGTPETFFDSIKSGQVTSGLVPRMLAFFGRPGQELRDLEYGERLGKDAPKLIIDEISYWHSVKTSYSEGVDMRLKYDLKEAVITREAFDRLKDHFKQTIRRRQGEDAVRGTLWSRTGEKTGKMALVLSASRTRAEEVSLEDVELAIKISNWSTRRMHYECSRKVADDDHAKLVCRVLEAIHSEPGISKQNLWKRIRMDEQKRAKVLQELQTSEEIEIKEIKTGGRPRMEFWPNDR